jgi:hypothetical protein
MRGENSKFSGQVGAHKGYENGSVKLGKRSIPFGIKAKDLIGIPWMLAFALRADGWWLRDCIIWAKQNPPPSSVRDRTCPSHEYVFLLARSPRYYYDHEAIEEPIAESSRGRYAQSTLETQTGGFKQEVYESGIVGARARSRRSLRTPR